MTRTNIAIFMAVGLFASSAAWGQSGLGASVDQALNLGDSSVQVVDFDLDPTAGILYAALEPTPGVTWTLELRKHSMRADSFQVLVDDGTGSLQPTAPPSVSTWKGTILEEPTARVRASFLDDELSAVIWATSGTWAVQPLSDAGIPGTPGQHVVYRAENVLPTDFECGVLDTAGLNPPTAPGPYPSGTGFQICQIGIDADGEYYQSNGSSIPGTVNNIENIMNLVEGVYEVVPITIVYEITVMVIRTNPATDPYTSTNHNIRLDQFQDTWNSAPENAILEDVSHLFTGVDLDGTVIGVANGIGVTCNENFGYCLSQATFSTNIVSKVALVAHELGHCWDATHCNSQSSCRIMCSGLGGCDGLSPLTFAPNPQSQIIAYRNAVSCLHELGFAQSLPFIEEWTSTSFNSDRWSYIDQVLINGGGDAEPSAPFSLNLDSPGAGIYDIDEIRSNTILMAGTTNPVFQYYTQHQGVESGETLTVEYLNTSLDWVGLNTITSNGVDQTSFEVHTHFLPTNARHNQFRIRFFTDGNQGNDDWYVDNITVTEGPPVSDPPEVTQIFPASGPSTGGTPITIVGLNFDPSAVVFIGSNLLQNVVVSGTTEIAGLTPPGSLGPADVIVTQGPDNAILTNGFTYVLDELRVGDITGPANSSVTVPIFATHELDLEGFSFGVDHDGDFATILDVTGVGTMSEGAQFFAPALNTNPEPNGGYWTLGVVIDLQNPVGIPAGADNVIVQATYVTANFLPVDLVIDLEIRDDLGVPPVPVSFVETGGLQVAPETIDGSITIGDGGAIFIRGDVDNDGTFNGLVDALALLNFGFTMGPPPPCQKAADTDDNGTINALVDGLLILTHQFNGGPPPAPPYPSPGADPTPDSLPCDI